MNTVKPMRNVPVRAFAAAVSSLLLAPALARAEERPLRPFAIGPTAGFHSGIGASALFRPSPVGLAVSGGYMPVFIFGNESESKEVRLNYYSSLQLDADVVIGPILRNDKVDLSLILGYRYNSVLGHGAGAGIAIELPLSERWAVAIMIAPSIFPQASDQLAEHDYPSDRDPSLPWLQGGAGAALWFYP